MKKFSYVLIATTIVLAGPAIASGSGSGGGGGYGSGSPSGVSQARDPYAEAYSKGRKMFAKRITCKTCTYNGGVNNGKVASEVAAKVKAGEFNLKNEERSAVLFYISERYSIRT